MRSIIVDDEENSHIVLKNLLKNEYSDVNVLASGYSVAEGVQLIETFHPDLVFLDIEMPDGTGFDLLQKIGHPDFKVIFITAHNQYAISAIRFGALDYLLKPLTGSQLGDSLDKVRMEIEKGVLIEKLKHAVESYQQLQQKNLPSLLLVSTIEGVHFIPVDDIIRFEANANCTEIFYSGAKKRLVAATNIGAYVEQFEPYPTFMKVHRAHFVNLNKAEMYIRGDSVLLMKDGSSVGVSRNFRDELLQRLKEL